MAKVYWTRIAQAEIDEIVWYIASKGGKPDSAVEIVDEIQRKALAYAESHVLGNVHPALPEAGYCFHHKRWLVFYDRHSEGILILRVVDASRDLGKLFGA